jgi:hypothetical protein
LSSLIEPLIAAVIAKLQADYPAKLAAVAAEYGDGVVPAAPTAYYGFLKDPRLPDFQFPAVVIGALPSDVAGREVAGAGDWRHTLCISYVAVDTTGDDAVLDKHMKRAGEALARLIEASPDAIGGRWEVVSIRYGEPAYILDQTNASATAVFQELPVVVRVMNYEVLT